MSFERRRMLALLLGTIALGLPAIARAVDGVVEINQAAALKGGITATDSPGFPVTIDSPGSYRLTGDVDSGAFPSALIVASDDVTLDLNGFRVLGAVVGPNNFSPPVAFVIENGRILANASNALQVGNDSRVVGLDVTNSGGVGIRCHDRCSVEDSYVHDTSADGIVCRFDGTGDDAAQCSIRRARIIDNGGVGVSLGDGGAIAESFVKGNAGGGIRSGFDVGPLCNPVCAGNVRIESNRVIENGNGSAGADFGILAGENAVIGGNTVAFNQGRGIVAGRFALVEGNTVVDNTQGGVEMLDGASGDASQARVRRNLIATNLGVELSLGAGASYEDNVLSDPSETMPVTGGLRLEGNVCNGASCPGKRFTLTTGAHNGANALAACPAGFHMAEIWELLDTTRSYDASVGQTRPDMGSGAPSVLPGWVRTGYISLATSSGTGLDNCNAWTSAATNHDGTAVMLNGLQSLGASSAHTWVTLEFACNATLPVYCASN